MPNQLTPILNSTKIALERQASEKFGAAVEEFTRGTLGPALGIPAPDPNAATNRNDGSFYSSSYAAALAGGTSFRPKLKFLFKVEFVFTEEAKAAAPELARANSQDFTFMVKSVDRPKIDFEFEDDVNMYNFRTKALKKIRHRELTMTFLDDTGNRVLDFFRILMMLHSPITRRQMLRQNSGSLTGRLAPPDAKSIQEGNGMNFSQLSDQANDTAIRGTINSSVGNVIQTVRVKQMYVNPGSTIGNAVEETIFDFMNARLVSFDLDDLSHEGSDANLITLQFDYDWMEIVNTGPLTKPDGPNYNVATPGVHGAPVDISPTGGSATNPQGAGGVFGSIISNSIGRAGQQITSSAINRAVQTIAGKGHFASLISSHASNIVGGLVGAAGRNVSTTLVNQAGAAFSNMNVIKAPSEVGSPTDSASGATSVMDSAVGGRAPVDGVTTYYPDGSWFWDDGSGRGTLE